MGLKKSFFVLLFLACGFTQAQNYIIYQVQPDDTPQSIALEYAISVDELYRLNPDLRKVKSLENQKIVIPGSEADNLSFVKYLVKTKETLYSISRTYNVSIEDIKAFNPHLYEKELQDGEVIRIPAYKLPKQYQNIDFNESIKNSNFSAFKHIVLPNEKKADIVKKYGISAKEFDSLNYGMIDVQSGQLVKIVREKNEQKDLELADLDMALQFYKVPRQQTMYSLTKEFKVSEDIIYKLNPILRNEGLKAGTILKLPEKIETLNIAEKIVNLENRIQNLSEKKLALILPFSLNKLMKDSASAKKVILKENLVNISLDFYDGVKLAIEEAEKLGIKTDLKIYDTKRNPKVMHSILINNSFLDRDAIIGPILNKNIKMLSDELKNSKIPIFLPINKLEDSPSYVFNTLPQKSEQTETLITLIDSTITDKQNLIFITDSSSQDKYQKYKYTFPQAKFYKVNKSYVEADNLERLLHKDKQNWIILESTQIGITESVVSILYRLNSRMLKEAENKNRYRNDSDTVFTGIRLFTSNRNSAFDNVVDNKALSDLSFTYVTVSIYDILEESPIIQTYIEKNGHAPNRYVLRAFDLTYDILLRLAYQDNLKKEDALKPITQYNENRFGYKKQFLTETYENKGLYIVQYKPDFEVQIINADKN